MSESVIVSKEFTNYADSYNANLVCRHIGVCSVVDSQSESPTYYDVYDCDLYLHADAFHSTMTIATNCPFDGFMSFDSRFEGPLNYINFLIIGSGLPPFPKYSVRISISQGTLNLIVEDSTGDEEGFMFGHARFYAVAQISN